MQTTYQHIAARVASGERLTREDGLALLGCNDLAWLGHLADTVKRRLSGEYVYFNVNRHINLTNICLAKCRFCAFGCDAKSSQAYFLSKENVLDIASRSARDPDLRELHIVSGLHPDWPFDHYVDIIRSLKAALPHVHLKAFTAVEICHFAHISGQSVAEVLQILKEAGLDSMPGGGAEIFSERVRQDLCPHKASAAEWLDIARTAHNLGIPTNATMLYGHIETAEERIDHLLSLRDLQDETGGFQTFLALPFHPNNTGLANEVTRASAWEDLKMVAVSRLMLDNFPHVKAYWIMLTLPVAQLALGFGADDIDGTVTEEKITHAAGARTAQQLDKDTLITAIRQTGHTPVERDSVYNIIKKY